MLSAHPIDVDRNCLVISSPKSVNNGAKSVNRLFSKCWLSVVLELALGAREDVDVAMAIHDSQRLDGYRRGSDFWNSMQVASS
jgi:hypothetical protein